MTKKKIAPDRNFIVIGGQEFEIKKPAKEMKNRLAGQLRSLMSALNSSKALSTENPQAAFAIFDELIVVSFAILEHALGVEEAEKAVDAFYDMPQSENENFFLQLFGYASDLK